MKRNTKEILIYIFFLMIMVVVIINKKNFHVDELLSYTLANNVNTITMDFEEGHTYEKPEQIYLENMVVYDIEEEFNLKNVWKNQTNDVHPPLYYLILHIICSFNAGRFSIWYAAMINMIFAVFTLYILRKLIYLFVEDNVIVDLGSILFIVSAGILQNVSFLRMYVMAMFWITCTAYLFVKALNEKCTRKIWIQMGLVAVAGALTHYYCIIYLCATCLVFGICLLIEKRWKDIGLLAAHMMAAGVISIAVFPAMLTHMFFGYRGTESIDNLTQGTWLEYWERMKNFYGFINTQMFGKAGGGGIVFVLLILIVFIVLQKEYDVISVTFDRKKIMKWMIAGVPLVMYFIFVSASAVYVTDRYLFPIYAVAFCIFLCMMTFLWKKLATEKFAYVIMCLIGTVFIVNGFAHASWDYLFSASSDLLNKAQTYSDRNCICVYDVKWKEQPAFYELKNYKSITFISQENINSILKYGDLFEDGFMLNITGGGVESGLSI